MPVSWDWIKQRPHFLAEELIKENQVDVLCMMMHGKPKVNKETPVRIRYPFKLPLQRFDFVKNANKWLRKHFLSKRASHYDIFWFTAPSEDCSFLISKIDSSKMVIYDCMDDMLSFPIPLDKRKERAKNERILIERANIVFASSGYLRDVLNHRYPNIKKIILVLNNALMLPSETCSKIELPQRIYNYLVDKRKKIVYIGTIAEWIDLQLCNEIIDGYPDVAVYMWGPYEKEVMARIHSERIILCGAVEHQYIYSIMEGADVLIMPFILNDLVLSVNPVKLYEYIMSGKPSLAPLYEESRQFEEYVYLYNDHKDCLSILNRIIYENCGAKQSKDKCLEYARMNTWEERGRFIRRVLNNELN